MVETEQIMMVAGGGGVAARQRPALALPSSAAYDDWSEDEKALLVAAGLWVAARGEPGARNYREAHWADRPTVTAFLAHCGRTGLDPIARQIYAIERAGKWTIQVSIDGMRVVAQRSMQYRGQTPVQWTADGKTWLDVWLSDDPPAAARVGVRRSGFDEPLYAVARWKSFAPYEDEWEDAQGGGRRKTGKRKPAAMWERMPDHMLAKVAEALALRKAFPMDLSGLYIAEEFEAEVTEGVVPGVGDEPPAVLRVAQRAPLPVVSDEPVPEVECERCHRVLPETEFAAAMGRDGFATLCNECLVEVDAEDAADRAADARGI